MLRYIENEHSKDYYCMAGLAFFLMILLFVPFYHCFLSILCNSHTIFCYYNKYYAYYIQSFCTAWYVSKDDAHFHMHACQEFEFHKLGMFTGRPAFTWWWTEAGPYLLQK